MYDIRIYYAYLTDGQCQKRDRGRDPTKDTARSETEAETGETAKRCIHTHLYPHAHTQSYVHVFVSVIHMNVSSAHTYTPKTGYKHSQLPLVDSLWHRHPCHSNFTATGSNCTALCVRE
jgi:hypothetical protein